MSIPWKYRIGRWIGHQHYIPRGRDRLIRSFAKPAGPVPFCVDFFGHKYQGSLDDYIDWSVYLYGAYSRNELSLLADIAKALPCPTAFYDVGANVGQHSLFMCRHVDHVIAFEPYEPVREKMLRKMADNNIRNVSVFPYGLGRSDKNLPFTAPSGENTGVGTFRSAEGDNLVLPVRRGDALLSERNLPPMSILKVDVEGFEAEVFEGLRQTIVRDRPIILTEISGPDRSGFGAFEQFALALYPDFQWFAVGCTSISGTYRLKPPSFLSDDEFLIVPDEKMPLVRNILRIP